MAAIAVMPSPFEPLKAASDYQKDLMIKYAWSAHKYIITPQNADEILFEGIWEDVDSFVEYMMQVNFGEQIEGTNNVQLPSTLHVYTTAELDAMDAALRTTSQSPRQWFDIGFQSDFESSDEDDDEWDEFDDDIEPLPLYMSRDPLDDCLPDYRSTCTIVCFCGIEAATLLVSTTAEIDEAPAYETIVADALMVDAPAVDILIEDDPIENILATDVPDKTVPEETTPTVDVPSVEECCNAAEEPIVSKDEPAPKYSRLHRLHERFDQKADLGKNKLRAPLRPRLQALRTQLDEGVKTIKSQLATNSRKRERAPEGHNRFQILCQRLDQKIKLAKDRVVHRTKAQRAANEQPRYPRLEAFSKRFSQRVKSAKK